MFPNFRSKRALSTLAIVLIVVVVAVALVVGGVVALFVLFYPVTTSVGPAGSGALVTVDKDISDFTVVDVQSGFEVVIIQSSSYWVSITADDNVFDRISVSKIGETLRIGLEPGLTPNPSTTLKAEITIPDLYELQLSGGSHGTFRGFRSSHDFVIGLSGGSHIVRSEGAANDLIITSSGGSFFDLSEFSVHNADVKMSGGSRGTINLDGRLDANLREGSHLDYIGEPTLGDITKSDGSTVEKHR